MREGRKEGKKGKERKICDYHHMMSFSMMGFIVATKILANK